MVAASVAAAGLVGDWGHFIGAMLVAGIFGFIPSGFIASYINFRFHQMGDNKEMAGLSAGFFAAIIYLIIYLFITLTLAIIHSSSAANFFIAWVISFVFGFIFMPMGGYLSGFLEEKPIAMPAFFDLSRLFHGAPPPPPPPGTAQLCPTCGRPLTYVKEYDRWYCTKCKKYA
jgi:MFS family permease